jgi:hypothetical protein
VRIVDTVANPGTTGCAGRVSIGTTVLVAAPPLVVTKAAAT